MHAVYDSNQLCYDIKMIVYYFISTMNVRYIYTFVIEAYNAWMLTGNEVIKASEWEIIWL